MSRFVSSLPPCGRAASRVGMVAVLAALALAGLSCRITEDETGLWVYANRVFYPGDKVVVEVQSNAVTVADMAVYPVDLAKLAAQPGANLHSLGNINFSGVRPLATWRQDLGGDEDYWNYREVEVPVKEEGAYLVTASARGYVSSALVVVSRLALVTKTDADTLLVYAADRMSGEPVPGVEILTFPSVTAEMATDARGLAVKNGIVPPKDANNGTNFVVMGRKGKTVTLCDSYFGYYSYQQYKGYAYTDRPVYRPGQTVRLKGILRRYNGAAYENLPGETVKVEVNGPNGEPAFKAELKTSDFGSYAAAFTLGDEPPLGRYNVTAKFLDQSFSSYFDVEEYRKPEYEVAVATAKDYYLPGEILMFDVTGKYYFGEPVARADCRYNVYRRARYYYGWRSYYYSWYYGEDDYYSDYGWEYVAEGTGQLDEYGHFRGTLPIPKDLSYNYEYRVDAVMTDASRHEVTGSTTVAVWRAGLDFTVYPDKYFYSPEETAVLTFKAQDPTGKPCAAEVSFDVFTEKWVDEHSGRWVEEKLKTDEVSVGAEGVATYRYTPPTTGYYQIKAKAADAAGREVAYAASFYVADENYYRSYYSGSGVTLTMDKDSYAPGDVALVMVQSWKEGAAVLLTVEGDDLYWSDVIRPQGNTALVKLPIERAYAPNVYVSATVVADDSYTVGGANVIVPPEDRFLKVDITPDKRTYRPRDAATFKVKTTDWKGAPVAAEVSLGVADESVYAIKPEAAPDIRQFFYDRRDVHVMTNTSFYFSSYGYAERELGGMGGGFAEDAVMLAAPAMEKDRKAEGKKSKDGEGQAYVQPVVRAYFPDTAFWGPQLVTDAAGEAVVNFDIPDSLTTWRATARAVTKDTEVGAAVDKVIARKDLLVRLETPRSLTQWDDVVISGVVHNYLPSDQRVKVELEAGPEVKVKGERVRYVPVPANGEARVDWPCFVDGVGGVKFTVKALTTVESDAMELTIPILPHGLEYAVAAARMESGSFEEKVTVPAEAVAGATVLEISLAPSLAGTMLDALDYLAGYPYGCVEQTMSRFLPTVYVAHTMQKLGVKNEPLETELPKMVKAGLDRLYNFQHDDGGWGWWTDDQTHPFMTAYVCYGLIKAREADFDVRDGVLEKGLTSLKHQLESKKAGEGATRLYMLSVLAEAGDAAGDGYLRASFNSRRDYDAYGLSLLALALQKRGMVNEAQVCADELSKLAVREGGFVHYAGVGEWHYSWADSPIQTTATALRALVAVRGTDDADLEGIVRWLSLNRRGNYWRSTQETAAVVFALADYLAATRELEGDYAARVFLNDKLVGEYAVTPADVATTKLHVDVSDKSGDLRPGENVVRVEMTGTGKVYYSTLLSYFRGQDELEPVDEGFVVSRRYYQFEKGGTELKEGIPDVVRAGDRFRVDVTFKNKADMEYVMLEDFLPSGFEVDEEALKRDYYYDWYYGNTHTERRDEKMAFFFTALPAGEHTVSYVIHAEQPGRHLALPARASLMYAPEIWGSSGEAFFDVALETRE